MKNKSLLIKLTLILLIPILFLYGIVKARNFLYPMAFGALFAYLLYPITFFLEKNRFPRILAILISIISSLAVISVIGFIFYTQFTHLFENFDTIKQTANTNIETLQQNLQAFIGLKDNRIEEFLKQNINSFLESGEGNIGAVFSATAGTIGRIVILPIYVFLFLFYRTKFAYFILKITKRENKKTVLKVLRDISSVAARYMGGVTIVVFILCILNSTGLLIIGVDYAILLGIISAFFNYIPYFGTLMGGAVPLLFVLFATGEPLQNALQVIILFTIVQFAENNILTPNIVGDNVRISPVFIIIGLVFGSMVWGIPGMLLIIPFLAISRIIFKNVDKLKPLAFLIGPRGTQKHSISMANIRKRFQIRKNKTTEED